MLLAQRPVAAPTALRRAALATAARRHRSSARDAAVARDAAGREPECEPQRERAPPGRIINKGTIKKNKGQIFENTDVGTIEDNSGDVAFNYGTIDRNTKEVWNNVGTVKDNNFYVFDNHGTVTRNKGKVGNSYGGTVTTNEGKLCDLPQGCSRTGQKPDWSILEAGSFEVEVDGFDSPDDAGCHCECAEHHCA